MDCTFGGGGHARLIADRLGPAGTLIGIDRDPVAEERFSEIAAELPCRTRFIRADFVSALEQLDEEGVRADLAYLDLGMSSMQVDTWERGLLVRVRRAARHADGSRAGADRAGDRQRVGRAPAGAAAARVRRGALREPDRPADRPRARARGARLDAAARRRDQVGGARAGAVRRRPPGAPDLPGAADRGQRRAVPARRGAAGGVEGAPDRWPVRRDLVPLARGPARQALPRRARARLRLPAGAAHLRVRPQPRGGAV